MEFFVARQPILDRQMQVFGYELLFRSSGANAYDGVDPDRASSSVIMGGTILLDMVDLTEGRLAFVNVTREALLQGIVEALPRDATVLEILETVSPDDAIARACRELKAKGYRIALDDFVYSPAWDDLLAVADIVKVDFLQMDRNQRRALGRHLPKHATLLAEKVETPEQFEEAVADGYELFQGYFFQKPILVRKRAVHERETFYAELLSVLQATELDHKRLVEVIKHDPSLTYKFFRFINRPSFGWRRRIEDMEQAIFLAGEREIRCWITLLLMASLGPGKPIALLETASVRARLSELLAAHVTSPVRTIDAFLVGIFSQLDAFTDRTMEEALSGLPIVGDVRDALLGSPNVLRDLLDFVLIYERGEWALVRPAAERLGVDLEVVPDLYVEAVRWASRGDPASWAA